MSAIAEFGDKLAGLTLKEAVELTNYMKEKHGIEPAAGVAAAAPTAAAPVAEKAAEPTEFNVILESVDAAKKINVIKIVRELTGQGLAEAKATVEGAPKAIKEGIDKKAAEDLKKKLEEAGGKVSVKPA